MSFLNPGLLWGCLLFLVPIIIYLIFQRKIKEMDWAAMQFLMDIMEQKRKTTIEDLLLLLLRILMILFLALAVSRPLFNAGPITDLIGSDADVVFLIDNSYSMGTSVGGQTRLERAKEKAIEITGEEADSAGFSLVLASELPDPIIAEFTSNASMEETIRNIKPTSLGSDWASSLHIAGDILKTKSKKGLKKLYVLTDFQDADWSDLDANTKAIIKDLNEQTQLQFVNTGDSAEKNLTAMRLRLSAGAMRVGSKATFAADIFNHGSELAEDVPIDFMVNGEVIESSSLNIASNQAASIRFQYEAIEDGLHEATIQIKGDSLDIDNKAYLPFNVVESINVLAVSEGENSYGFLPTHFAEMALNPYSEGSDSVDAIYAFQNIHISDLAGEDLNQYAFICISGVSAISSVEASILEEYAQQGGGILMFLGKGTDVPTLNNNLYKKGDGLFAWPLAVDMAQEENENDAMSMRPMNFSHPLWTGLVDHQNNYLKHVKVYNAFTFKKGGSERAVALAELISSELNEEEATVIVDFAKGRGHCLVVGTSSDLSMNDFISHPVFVGFINQAVKYAKSFRHGDDVSTAGSTAQRFVDFQSSNSNFVCTSPNGDTIVLAVKSTETEHKIELPELRDAGFYSLVKENDASERSLVAANVSVEEGNVLSIESEAVKALFPDLDLAVSNSSNQDVEGSGFGGAELASLLLLLVLLCWMGENYLAYRISQR